jgi:hypothetical protein
MVNWQETAALQWNRKSRTVTNELIDSLLADYRHPEGLIGEDGLLKMLTKNRESFPSDDALLKLFYLALA